MENKTKAKVALASVAVIVAAFAVGRFTTPVKVRIETKIVEVEKKIQVKNKRKETKVVETTKPDGSKEKTKTIVEDSRSDTVTDRNTVAEKTEEKNKGSASKTSLHFLAGATARSGFSGNFVFGGLVSRQVLGPVQLGIWGLSNLTFGASVGAAF